MNIGMRKSRLAVLLGQAESTKYLTTGVDRYLAEQDRVHNLDPIAIIGQGPKKYPWWVLLAVPVITYVVMEA